MVILFSHHFIILYHMNLVIYDHFCWPQGGSQAARLWDCPYCETALWLVVSIGCTLLYLYWTFSSSTPKSFINLCTSSTRISVSIQFLSSTLLDFSLNSSLCWNSVGASLYLKLACLWHLCFSLQQSQFCQSVEFLKTFLDIRSGSIWCSVFLIPWSFPKEWVYLSSTFIRLSASDFIIKLL